MADHGRRRGDGVSYKRGSGSVEVELANVQSCLEELHPTIMDLEYDVRELRSDRDSVKGMLKVIVAFQALIVGLIITLFSWGLNHMTFRADFYESPHSSNQSVQSNVSTESHPQKGQ